MRRILIILIALAIPLIAAPSAQSVNITAQDIFDKMIHYECDQLAVSPNVSDYQCSITETTVRPGSPERQVIDKTLFFMVPMFQLQLVGEEPVFYFDQDLMLVLLDSMELVRDNDAIIGDVPCYVIMTRPVNPAYRQYSRTYYVAQDDYRHVRTISHHASEDRDDLITQIDYTYSPVEGFKLLTKTVALTKDENDIEIATVTDEYKDYQFSVGLSMEFFTNYVGNREPNLPQS
jgi:hypothetical protein